jgi:hypothetical protein
VVEHQSLGLALEQELQAGWLFALLGDRLAGRDLPRAGDRHPLGELAVVEVVEEVDRAQLFGGDRGVGQGSARYS